jgi:hypothetical protein
VGGLVRVVLHHQRCSFHISGSIGKAFVEWRQVGRRHDDMGANAGCSRGSGADNRRKVAVQSHGSRASPRYRTHTIPRIDARPGYK